MKNQRKIFSIIVLCCFLLYSACYSMPVSADTQPTTPSGLTGSQIGNTQLRLTWDANCDSNFKCYVLNITTVTASGKKSLAITSTTENTCTFNITIGSTYTCKVMAMNTSGEKSSYSEPITIKPENSDVNKAVVESTDNMTSSSNSSDSGSSINTTQSENNTTNTLSTPSTNTASTPSEPNTTAGTDSTGSVSGSDSSNLTENDTNAQSDNNTYNSTSTQLTNTSSNSNDTGTTSGTSNADSTSNSNSSSDTVSERNTQDDIVSTADTVTQPTETVANPTPAAIEQNAQQTIIAAPPSAPTGLKVSSVGNGFVTLCWNPNSEVNFKEYILYYQPASGSWNSVSTTATTYTLNGLTNNILYSFKINAADSEGQTSNDSEMVTATPSTDVTAHLSVLGQPFSKGTYANNVWDMQVFNGKIYLGHGNSTNSDPSPNAGPIPVIYYDPQTKQFVNQYTVNEEQIDVFRVIDGKLTIPGHDARDSWDYANYYVMEDGVWKKIRTIPIATHVFDMTSYKGKLYAAVEEQSHDKNLPADIAVTASSDGGKTWVSQMPANSSLPFGTYACIGKTLFEFKGKLYAIGTLMPGYNTTEANNIMIMDGNMSTIQKMTNLLPGAKKYYSYRIIRPTTVNNNLVYLGVINVNGCQWIPDSMYVAADINQPKKVILPETNVLPADIITRGNTAYVLSYVQKASNKYSNIVYKSDDLNTWTEVFRFDTETFVRSFEELGGDFYFGLGCNTTNLASSTGKILQVPFSAYRIP